MGIRSKAGVVLRKLGLRGGGGAAANLGSAQQPGSILDQYCMKAPDPQNAVDIFKHEWSMAVPGAPELEAGPIDLTRDERLIWAEEQLGPFAGRRILELGPLEANHTYQMDRAGAESVTSIEANTRAFLKCLIAKEIVGLPRVKFLLGDFVKFLETKPGPFDLCVASGVLYHMPNPVELLSLIAQNADRVLLWTHYYEKAAVERTERVRQKFGAPQEAEYSGFRHTLHPYGYGDALGWSGFCGGAATGSNWLSRDTIIDCLKHFGYQNVVTGKEQPDHINGPAFCVAASK